MAETITNTNSDASDCPNITNKFYNLRNVTIVSTENYQISDVVDEPITTIPPNQLKTSAAKTTLYTEQPVRHRTLKSYPILKVHQQQQILLKKLASLGVHLSSKSTRQCAKKNSMIDHIYNKVDNGKPSPRQQQPKRQPQQQQQRARVHIPQKIPIDVLQTTTYNEDALDFFQELMNLPTLDYDDSDLDNAIQTFDRFLYHDDNVDATNIPKLPNYKLNDQFDGLEDMLQNTTPKHRTQSRNSSSTKTMLRCIRNINNTNQSPYTVYDDDADDGDTMNMQCLTTTTIIAPCHPVKTIHTSIQTAYSENCLMEPKLHGNRVLSSINLNCHPNIQTKYYTGEIDEIMLWELPLMFRMNFKRCVLDGIMVLHDRQTLQPLENQQLNFINYKRFYPVYYIFDIQRIDNFRLLNTDLHTRKRILESLILPNKYVKLMPYRKCTSIIDACLYFEDFMVEYPTADGIIFKKPTDKYRSGVRLWKTVT